MSGSTLGGIVGAGVGFLVGGPAGAQWGAWIGSGVGGLVAPGTIKGPKLGDAQTQTSQAGIPRPVVFGHPAPFAGNLIDGETKARKITRKTKQGKGGPTVKTEVFLLTSAIRVCEGPIGGFIRIWEDDVVVYDARTTFPDGWDGYSQEVRVKQSKWLSKAALYLGTEDQLPDPELEAIHGVGNTPYYRGTAYIRVKDAESQDGTAKRYRFEVASSGTAATDTDYLLSLNPEYYYKLDDSGPTFIDSSGNSRQSLTGYGTYVTGSSLGLLNTFDGAHRPSIDNTGLSGASNWTILVRVQLNDTSDNGIRKSIVTSTFNDLFGYNGYKLYLDGTNNMVPYVQINADGGGGFTAHGSDELGTDTEYVLGARRTGSLLEALQDASVIGTATVSGTIGGGSQIFYVGGSPTYGGGAHMNVSELIAFRYALSDEQLRNAALAMGSLLPGFVGVPDTGGSFWDLLRRSLHSPSVTHSTFDADSGVSLASVEAAIMSRCNIPAGKVNVSAVAGISIPGFLVTDQPTGADALLPLLQATFHDLPEVDGMLVARLRGGAVAMAFTDDDLIDTGEDEEVVRPQEIEFPLKVSVVTQDPDADYAPIPQVSLRFSPSVQAASEVVFQVPIPFQADDAARIAHKMHKIAWSNAEARIERVLPMEFVLLVPSDPVSYNGRRWLVTERDYADGEVRIKAVYERATDVSSTVAGQPVSPPTPPTGTILGPTVFAALNLPSLRPEDNVPGMYLAAMGVLDGWTGADIYLSTDGGLTETLVLEIVQASKLGELVEDEPSSGDLTVRLYDADDTLDNVTTAQVEAGQNVAAIVDASDVAELIGYEVATEDSAGDWELSTLTRGLLGTDEVNHVSGDRFVPVDYLYFLPIDAAFANQTLMFRAVTKGTTVDANPTLSVVFAPGDIIVDGGGDPL